MGRPRATPRDPGSAAVSGLTDLTVVVGRRARLAEVPGAAEELVRFSFWRRGRSVEVATGDAVVEPGDHVVVVGGREAVAGAVGWLGARADEHLAHDRRQVDYRRVLLSNAQLAGRTVAELDLPGGFGGVVTRVRRGDLDLLARDGLHVLLGDRLRVVVPRAGCPRSAATSATPSAGSARWTRSASASG
jgi:putative transport protein